MSNKDVPEEEDYEEEWPPSVETDDEQWNDPETDDEQRNDPETDDEQWNNPKGLLQQKIEEHIKQKAQYEDIDAPIKADIYQIMALQWEGASWRSVKDNDPDTLFKFCILYLILAIQLVGPFAIFVWAIYSLDWSNVEVRMPHHYERGSMKYGVSCITTRAMSSAFLFLFTLFGVTTLLEDDETLIKLRLMNLSMRKGGEEGTLCLNYVGPLVNSWVILMTCVDMLLLFFMSDSPKDVLYDSLGLLFLFNLDDIPNQMNSLMPHWPANTVGQVYNDCLLGDWRKDDGNFLFSGGKHNPGNLLNDNWELDVADPDQIMDNIKDIEKKYEADGIGRNCIYFSTRVILRPMVLMLPIAYLLLCDSIVKLGDE